MLKMPNFLLTLSLFTMYFIRFQGFHLSYANKNCATDYVSILEGNKILHQLYNYFFSSTEALYQCPQFNTQ